MGRAPSPSDGVKDVSGLRHATAIVHGGRPVNNYGLPPALFHPALAKFDYHLRHLDQELDELKVDSDFLCDVHLFIQRILNIYDSEDARSKELNVLINKLVGPGGERQVTSFEGAKPDIMWLDPYLTTIAEEKNEFGIGGDAFLQAALSYAKVVGSNMVCFSTI